MNKNKIHLTATDSVLWLTFYVRGINLTFEMTGSIVQSMR